MSSEKYTRQEVAVSHYVDPLVEKNLREALDRDPGEFLFAGDLHIKNATNIDAIINIWLLPPGKLNPNANDVGFYKDDIEYLRKVFTNIEKYQVAAPLYVFNPPRSFNLLSLIALKLTLKHPYDQNGEGFYHFLCDTADELQCISDIESVKMRVQNNIRRTNEYFEIP